VSGQAETCAATSEVHFPIVPFLAYAADGRIGIIGSCVLSDLALQSAPGLTYAIGTGAETQDAHYVSGGTVLARPACPVSASLAARVVTLTGVPIGAPWVVSGPGRASGTTDAATMVFSFTGPGTFALFVDCFPAQDFNQEFTVT
jgi:hypothetical protein